MDQAKTSKDNGMEQKDGKGDRQNHKIKNDRHEGFARGHPPYYWPRLSGLNFLDLTG